MRSLAKIREYVETNFPSKNKLSKNQLRRFKPYLKELMELDEALHYSLQKDMTSNARPKRR